MNKIFIIFALCFFSWPAVAGDGQLQAEVDHLINYVRSTDCKFIRNGNAHTPDEAIEHILKKYDHFEDRIKTAEDFIEYCASKSILSKKPYKIGCPDQEPVESNVWFLEELERFRKK
jgi:hypothetical protein